MNPKKLITRRDIYSAYLILSLIALSLWTELDQLGALPLGLWVGLLILLSKPRRGLESFDKRISPFSPPGPTAKNWMIGVLILFPYGLFLAFTWNQEIPFQGRETAFVLNSLQMKSYWKNSFPFLVLATFLFLWVSKKSRGRFWGLSFFLSLLAVSFFCKLPPTALDQPSVLSLFASPFLALSERLHWNSALSAPRLIVASAIGFWLFILRPLFLKRWPDERTLLFSCYYFLQKDVLYLFTSAAIEPWAVILLLLAFEALAEDQTRWTAPLWTGLSGLISLQTLVLLPFVVLLANVQRNKKEIALELLVLGLPCLTYLALGGLPPFELGEISLKAQSLVFSRQIWNWFGISGTAVMGILICALFCQKSGEKNLRSVIPALSFVFLLPYLVSPLNSHSFGGLALFAVATVGATLLIANFPNKSFSMGLAALIVAAQLPSLLTLMYQAAGPDSRRYEMLLSEKPVFFPIRELIEMAETKQLLRPTDKISLALPNPEPLWEYYWDLSRKYEFDAVEANPNIPLHCDCTSKHPIVLQSGQQGFLEYPSLPENCVIQMESSCVHTLAVHSNQGEVVGMLGIGYLGG